MKDELHVNVAIGPLVGEYGGVTQHVKNIIMYSEHVLTPILPSPFSIHYNNNRFKLLARWFSRTYRKERLDIYGLLLSHLFLSRFDVVHLHGHPYWPEIYCKPKHRRARYVHSVHQVYLKEDCRDEREWRFRQWLNNLLFIFCRESDVVISVAKWQQRILHDQNIESIYIPNGVNALRCEKANAGRFMRKYGIRNFLLFVGRIHRYKRPEMFVELARRMPKELFVMIGSDITINNLKAYLNLNVPENVMCLGMLPYRDVLDAFAACKVFILPSKNETFPTVLLEAMACKKPIVATNNAGPKEIVDHGVDGLLFEPDNINDLYEKTCWASEHNKIGKVGYEKVKQKFDWPCVVKQIDEVYEKLAK